MLSQNIFDRHSGDVSLATELGGEHPAPVLARYRRDVAFVAKQIINNEHARFFDALLDRLIPAKVLLVEWEGKRIWNLRGFGGLSLGSLSSE